MTTERERIDKMLAEGKVSAKEAERLRAALEGSEREEMQAPPGPREEITRPRLSRLALAGALGVPAGIVTWLFVFGLGICLADDTDSIVAGAFIVAFAVMLIFVALSAGGLVVIRQAPDKLTGRRLAHLGIWLPTGLIIAWVTSVAIIAHLQKQRSRKEARRLMEKERAVLQRAEEEAERRDAEYRRRDWDEIVRRAVVEAEAARIARDIAERREPRPTVHVHTKTGAERASTSTWLKEWHRPEEVDRIEVRYGERWPARSAKARAGRKSWPFVGAKDAGSLELPLTPEVRKAWRDYGSLLVEAEGARGRPVPTVLHARPEKLDIERYATFTIIQRRSKDVPGSRGYLNVRIGDITAGQVLVTVRRGGETVIDATSVARGDVLQLKLGEADYTLRLASMVNLLIGDDFVTFVVHESKFEPVWRKIDRLLAHVEKSELTFVRNGIDHTGAATAAHLRKKLAQAKPAVATIDDFIEKVASRSLVTGKPYRVKLPAGKTVEAAQWLREQAKKLDAKAAD